jgi:transposase
MAPQAQGPKKVNPHPRTVLSDAEIMRILTLRHKGLKSRAIAMEVGRSQSSVPRILRSYDYKTFKTRDLTRIHKRKTTKHEDRILLRTAKAHDNCPFRDIITRSGIKASQSTLCRRLKEVDLFSCIRRCKPVLKPRHCRSRLQWARERINWTFNRVIWSDESLIVLGRKSRRRRCTQKKAMRSNLDIVMEP